MPSLQAIREFNESLVRLAGEPDVVKDWGEEIETPAAPEGGLDTDLSSLLADTGDLSGGGDIPVTDAEGAAPPDFNDLLGDDISGESTGPDISFEDTGLESELSEPEPEPWPEPDFAEAEPDFPAAEPAGEPAAPSGEDDVDFSDFEALWGDGSFEDTAGADLATPEPEPVEPASAEPAVEGPTEPEVETSEDDIFGTGDFEGFEIDADAFSFDTEPSDANPDLEPGPDSGAGLEPEPEPEAEPTELLSEDDGFSALDGELEAFEFSDEDPDSGEPEIPGDDFSFGDVSGFGDEAAGGEATEDFGGLDDGLDEFSLGDFGAEFGVVADETPATEEDLNPASNVVDFSAETAPIATGNFRISEGEFTTLRATFSALPLNLRQEVAGIINEAKGTTDEVEELVRRLASGESPLDIAAFAGRILGRTIRIPRGYEKRTGEAFEVERQSFAYQFRENILPIIRLVAIAAVLLVILGLGAYHLVYRPLHGRSLYREGLALIAEDQYDLGNRTFERARGVWASSTWFYTYAEAFIAERRYTLAAEKYEQLLFGMTREERDFFTDRLENRDFGSIVLEREPEKQGILDYAGLESEILGNYERADLLLQLVLYQNPTDYDGWLAIGDNNMRWARTDSSRYDDARAAFARLMERYGQTDTLLFRMLQYFVRTDNLDEVLVLKDAFQADARAEIDPGRYTEMAGYLVDKGELNDVESVLFRVMEIDPVLPELHYHLARYYRIVDVAGAEQLALQRAVEFLAASDPLTRDRRAMLVDTHTRIGENRVDAELFVEAQESFAAAIEFYEEGVRRRMLEPAPMFGRAYAGMADILYYEGRRYDDALRYYNSAESNGYTDPNLDYKQGFILYRNEHLDMALSEFLNAAKDPSASTNALLWATANTYYQRGTYFAAEAYYRELLERAEAQMDGIKYLLVDEDPLHRSVVEYLIRVNNNLGVTLSRLDESNSEPAYFSSALVYLTQSIQYSENYRRDPDTLARSSAVNLAYLNQRELIYPTPEYAVQIHTELPEDLDDLVF